MLFSKKKTVLGVDIGTSHIKIAEVIFENTQKAILSTYGIVNSPFQLDSQSDSAVISQIAVLLKNLVERAGVSTRKCVISLPNSAVFTSVVELPVMHARELASAVEFEAKKYVPLALTDVDLSWVVIGEGSSQEATQKVLLTAVPKQIVSNYRQVFSLAGLTLEAGEIEALALIRSLIGGRGVNCVIIDIGAKSTGINIIEAGLLRLSRNLNIGGETITKKIAQTLNISFLRAEQFKKDFGMHENTFLPETIRPVLNLIKNEVKQLLMIFQSHGARLDTIMLVGGGALLPGLVEYFADLGVPVELGDPLRAVAYQQEAAPVLKRYALALPIAIGLALRRET